MTKTKNLSYLNTPTKWEYVPKKIEEIIGIITKSETNDSQSNDNRDEIEIKLRKILPIANKFGKFIRDTYSNNIDMPKWAICMDMGNRLIEGYLRKNQLDKAIEELHSIIVMVEYCIPCEQHKMFCDHCIFGEKFGVCIQVESTFAEVIGYLNNIEQLSSKTLIDLNIEGVSNDQIL